MKIKKLFKSSLFLRIILLTSLFIILLIGGFTYKHISNLTNSTKIVIYTYEVNVELENINSYLNEAESVHRKYMLTKDSLYLENYLIAREKINTSFVQLKQLTIENVKQQENLAILKILIDNLFINFAKTDALIKNDEMSTETFKTLLFEEKVVLGVRLMK